MLVLTRRVGEAIQIGENVVVTIIHVAEQPRGRFKVRVAVDAPKSVSIVRTELLAVGRAAEIRAARPITKTASRSSTIAPGRTLNSYAKQPSDTARGTTIKS